MVQYYKYVQFILNCRIFYKNNPSLLWHDYLTLYTLTSVLIVTLSKYNLHYIILIFLIFIVVLWPDLKVHNHYELFSYLPLVTYVFLECRLSLLLFIKYYYLILVPMK